MAPVYWADGAEHDLLVGLFMALEDQTHEPERQTRVCQYMQSKGHAVKWDAIR
jgi:hypothetical protein